MKIQKHMTAVMALLLVLSLCACTPVQQTPETTTLPSVEGTLQESTAEETMPEAYQALLTAVVTAFPNVSGLSEYPGLSKMYDGHTSLTELGYALADIDGDGSQELLLKSMESPFVYDAFTIIDGSLVQLFSGSEHVSYRLYEDGYVENQWSENENIRGTDYYRVENGALVLFDRVTMDVEYASQQGLIENMEDPDTNLCFFRSESDNKEDYVSVTAQEALTLQQSFVEDHFHLLPAFVPLSAYGQ